MPTRAQIRTRLASRSNARPNATHRNPRPAGSHSDCVSRRSVVLCSGYRGRVQRRSASRNSVDAAIAGTPGSVREGTDCGRRSAALRVRCYSAGASKSAAPIGTVPRPPAGDPRERDERNGCKNVRCDAPSKILCGLLSRSFKGPEILSDFFFRVLSVHGPKCFTRPRTNRMGAAAGNPRPGCRADPQLSVRLRRRQALRARASSSGSRDRYRRRPSPRADTHPARRHRRLRARAAA